MAALQKSEVDWWENPIDDMLPLLCKVGGIMVEVQDPTGLMGGMRFSQLQPPFNNPAIRRAVLKGVSQQDFRIACVGDDPSLWHAFQPGFSARKAHTPRTRASMFSLESGITTP